MLPYFNNPVELKQLNNLIDNDTTIEKNIFKKQLINNYSDYKNDIITYTETNDYTVNTFYGFLRQFLINKNDLVSTENNYNLVDLGLENSNDVINQLNKQKQLENKQKSAYEATLPDSEEETQLKDQKLNEYTQDISDKDFENQKPNQITEIYEWVGELQTNNTYSTTDTICSKKFELGKLIKTHLTISDFGYFKSRFQYSKSNPQNLLNKSDFINTYNFFKSIFTGEAYENKILDDNELHTFIKT